MTSAPQRRERGTGGDGMPVFVAVAVPVAIAVLVLVPVVTSTVPAEKGGGAGGTGLASAAEGEEGTKVRFAGVLASALVATQRHTHITHLSLGGSALGSGHAAKKRSAQRSTKKGREAANTT